MFLAHYVGGGIEQVLNLYVNDFFKYLDEAVEFYKLEAKRPVRVVLAGLEKN